MDFHFNVSLIKSVVRIVGFLALPWSFGIAIGLLVFGEVLGIVEEF